MSAAQAQGSAAEARQHRRCMLPPCTAHMAKATHARVRAAAPCSEAEAALTSSYQCSSQGHAAGQHAARKAVAALMCSGCCS